MTQQRRRSYRPVLLVALLVGLGGGAWLSRLVLEDVGVGRARTYWSSPQGEPGGLLYVALGDSAAQGVGASRPERGYVGLLAARLSTRCGSPVRVVNLSVSGATVADVLRTQVPALARLRPDIVTVGAGGNDVVGFDAGRFTAEVELLTAALPAGSFVADVPYFMHAGFERHALQAAGVVSRSAARHNLPVVPLHAALAARGWSAMLTDFAPDLFHPNDRGHRVWADAFWAVMSTRNGVRCGP